VSTSPHAHDHDHGELDPPHVDEVADGIFAYIQPDGTWWLNNTGFLVGSEGVVAIDTCATERRTHAFLDAVAARSTQPIRTVVNTHHHGDHTHGNYLTWPATIVAHRRARDEMEVADPAVYSLIFGNVEWGDLRLAKPTLVVDDHVSLFVDDLEVELHYIGGPAHTTNDLVAWVPSRSVLFTGDLVFNGGMPFVVMGSVRGALDSVERLRAFGATTIVPGHGPVCGPEVLDGIADYYRFVLDVAERAHPTGTAPLDVARQTDLGRFAQLTDGERFVGNLHRAYAELDGAERGAKIDVSRAIMDMVAYNGGQPLRCLA
jgi:cyclase